MTGSGSKICLFAGTPFLLYIFLHSTFHFISLLQFTPLLSYYFLWPLILSLYISQTKTPLRCFYCTNWEYIYQWKVFIFSQNHFLFIYCIVSCFPFFSARIATNSINMLHSCTTAYTKLFFTKRKKSKKNWLLYSWAMYIFFFIHDLLIISSLICNHSRKNNFFLNFIPTPLLIVIYILIWKF